MAEMPGIYPVHGACFAGDVEDVFKFVVLVIEAVHHIGVVPEDAEIVCRSLHGGEPFHHAVRESDARGIGILGHAPDAFDGIVLSDQRLHDVHIGTVLFHTDGDHLYAELLADGEVAVVARSGTDELHLFEAVPGSGTEHAELFCEMHEGVHQIQTAPVAHEHLGVFHSEELGKERLARLGAAKVAVVARVGGVCGIVVRGGVREHGHRDLELFLGGSAAGHIHVSALFDEFFEAFLLIFEQGFQFLDGKRFVIHDPPVAAGCPLTFHLSYHKTRASASANYLPSSSPPRTSRRMGVPEKSKLRLNAFSRYLL